VHSIYQLTNTVNGKIYIGLTNNYKKRLREHSYASNDYYISRAIRSYGWASFTSEVLETASSLPKAREREKHYISELCSNNPTIGYNLTEGGEGTLGVSPTAATRAKMSKAKTGRTLSPSHRQAISDRNKGKTHSPKTRNLIREKLKGNKNFLGHKHSSETKKHLSEQKAKTWYIVSPEGENIEVTNLRSFCLNNNMSPSAMSRVVNGKQRHHKGWTRQSPSDTSASE